MRKDKNNYRLLVIEDNIGDFILVEQCLLEQIVAPIVSHARSFAQTKEILATAGERFDIILLDLSLPDRTGEELIREVLQLCGDTPVIVLTGFADTTFGVKSLSLGVSDYLIKDELTPPLLYKSIIYSLERQKTLLDLLRSKKKYRELFHLSPQPMWVFDRQTLKFMDVNKAAIEHYGYSKQEFLTMTIRDIRPVEDLPLLDTGLEMCEAEDEKSHKGVYKHLKKDGTLIRVDIQTNRIRFRGRNAKLVLAMDVTERLNYIKAVEKQNALLREISWIQSHKVRAPLARIMGLVPMLRDCGNLSAEDLEVMSYLLTSVGELDQTIREITDKTVLERYNDPLVGLTYSNLNHR